MKHESKSTQTEGESISADPSRNSRLAIGTNFTYSTYRCQEISNGNGAVVRTWTTTINSPYKVYMYPVYE